MTESKLPAGYRGGIITAITVFLGFTLNFIRYWAFESRGEWSISAYIVIVVTLLSLVFQVYALVRALRLNDENESEYNKTVKWFAISLLIIFSGLFIAILVSIFANK